MKYVLLLSLALTANAPAFATPDWYRVTDVDMRDATRGFLFQDNKLFVGKVGDGEFGHRVEVFNATGETLLERIEFPHSVTQIYPRGAKTFLVTGKAYTDQWYTYYTEVDWSQGSFRKNTRRISPQWQINEFGSVGGRNYFTEPGSRGVYRESNGRLTQLPFEISFPSQINDLNGAMWLLEKRGPTPGDESLVKIDLRRQTLSRVAGIEGSYGPYNLKRLDAQRLVMDDRLGNRIAVVDGNTEEVAYSIDLPHTPMNVEPIGSCALVPTGDAKMLHVVTLDETSGKLVASYDLSAIPGEFTNVIEAEVDAAFGLVFLRSVAPCMFCDASQSAVYAVKTDLDWQTACQLTSVGD